MNSPTFVSKPHFYLADKFYADQFQDGSLKADGSMHESQLWMEPLSSIPVKVREGNACNLLLIVILSGPDQIANKCTIGQGRRYTDVQGKSKAV